MFLNVNDWGDTHRDIWVLESGASQHLVNDETLLIDSAACDHEIVMVGDESLHPTQVCNVRLKVKARGVESTVMLTDVYPAPRPAKIIVSHGKLERKVFALVYDGEKCNF